MLPKDLMNNLVRTSMNNDYSIKINAKTLSRRLKQMEEKRKKIERINRLKQEIPQLELEALYKQIENDELSLNQIDQRISFFNV